MKYFVDKNSIVRQIWGKTDIILFVFAGAAAEFALNKAVDWLYFTGKLPANPLERLLSTVTYARKIVFSEIENANTTIDKISAIHKHVEKARSALIPEQAYSDVLFMLIYYSIASYELLERKLSDAEKSEVYDVFYKVGSRMHIANLPDSYNAWLVIRNNHLQQNLELSHYTTDLYQQYKKHLGIARYSILLEAQALIVPGQVKELLKLRELALINPLLQLYRLSRIAKLDNFIRSLILPSKYRAEIQALDIIEV